MLRGCLNVISRIKFGPLCGQQSALSTNLSVTEFLTASKARAVEEYNTIFIGCVAELEAAIRQLWENLPLITLNYSTNLLHEKNQC